MELLKRQNVQELMIKDLMEEDTDKNENELLELLEFTKENGVPLTDHQVRAMFLLNEFEMSDIAIFANSIRPQLTPTKKFFTLINKLTLADRIKGNAKLDKLLKANMSANQSMPSAAEYQAKSMKKSEIGG
jgi:hypothetical protein